MRGRRRASLALAPLAVVALLAACAGCRQRAVCGPQQLASIEAAYVAEMLAACQGHTRQACPAAKGIEERAHGRREEWIRCAK